MNRSTAASDPPQQWIGHAEQPESCADADAVDGIDERLHHQEAAQARRGVIERLGGRREMAVARERDDPVAHVALFEQHENHEDGHEPGRAEGRQQARDPRRQTEVDAHLVGDHDRRRLTD